jgi:uncharacterized protein YjbI with pentapeptide repeats
MAAATAEGGKLALERIAVVVGSARTIWLSQLAFLAFIGITLLSVRDLDFFSVSARIDVPLLGVTIPTTTFFLVAPWLATVLHVYFHLFLLKLWDALAEAPPTVDSLPLGERVFPWLVVDWALRRRPDRPVTPRPMDGLASVVTGLLIWLATPLLITAFWWRSMPAHDARLTLAIAAALMLSLYASLRGWRRARHSLKSTGRDHSASRRRGLSAQLRRLPAAIGALLLWLGMLATLPLVTFGSLAGAGWHHLPAAIQPFLDAHWPGDERLRPPLVGADLAIAEIVEKPADWLARDTAERHVRTDWCQDRGLPPDTCHAPVEPYQQAAREAWCAARTIDDCAAAFARLDAAFAADWQEQRGEYLANLARPDLSGRDLRRANAPGAFLAKANLTRARLSEANLFQARLEEANLYQAPLERANLGWARLEGANLFQARLEEANLFEARLEWANLFQTRLEDADLRVARLDGTYLGRAWLDGANLAEARLDGANLTEAHLWSVDWDNATFSASPAHSADFTGGRNLTQSQLAQVIGNSDTILPLDAETGEQLYVWTCWAEPPPTFDALLYRWPKFMHADLRAEWLCPPGVAPERTGRPADPEPAAPSAD